MSEFSEQQENVGLRGIYLFCESRRAVRRHTGEVNYEEVNIGMSNLNNQRPRAQVEKLTKIVENSMFIQFGSYPITVEMVGIPCLPLSPSNSPYPVPLPSLYSSSHPVQYLP